MNEKMKMILFFVGLGLALFLVHKLFKGVRGFAESTGLIESGSQKTLSEMDAFKPTYWQNKPGALLFSAAAAKKMADDFNKADGLIYTSDSEVLALFKKFKSWTQISQVADKYQQLYKRDLYKQLIEDGLSESTTRQVLNYIKTLPKK